MQLGEERGWQTGVLRPNGCDIYLYGFIISFSEILAAEKSVICVNEQVFRNTNLIYDSSVYTSALQPFVGFRNHVASQPEI